MQKFKKIFSLLSIFMITLVSMFLGKVVSAEQTIVPVDPNKGFEGRKQHFIIDKDAKITAFDVKVEGNANTSTVEYFTKSKDSPQPKVSAGITYFQDFQNRYGDGVNTEPFKTMRYGSFPKNYGSKAVKITNPTGKERITVNHGKQGTTIIGGKIVSIDLVIEYTDFHIKLADKYKGKVKENILWFDASENAYGGAIFAGAEHMKATYHLINTETKEELQYANSYITFNSLNMEEWVEYINPQPNTKVFITNDSNIVKTNLAGSTYKKDVFTGLSNDFEDELGKVTFPRNSATFEVSDKAPSFRIGTNHTCIWFTPSSATTFLPDPKEPNKDAKDPVTGETITGKPISAGQKIDFPVTVPVHNLSNQILFTYQKFNVTDQLPPELEILEDNPVTILRDTGEDITKDFGKVEIKLSEDKKSQHVTAIASKDFMANGIKYNGESYQFIFHTRVKDGVKDGQTIENLAVITINDQDYETGTKNPTYKPNKLNKKIKVGDKLLDHHDLKEDQKEVTFWFEGEISDNPNIELIQLKDVLEEPFTFKSIKFYDPDKKDITENFKRDTTLVENNLEFNSTKEQAQKLINKKVTAEMVVKVKKNYDLSKYKELKIPNSATLSTNFDSVKSNEVTVTPAPNKAQISKMYKNDKGELVDYLKLTSNDQIIPVVGEFIVPNAKDFTLKSVAIEEPLYEGLTLVTDKDSYSFKDPKGKSINDQIELSTKDDGKTHIFTFKKDYLAMMKGQKFTFELSLKLNPDFDVSTLKEGTIPNHFNLVINGDPTESNIPLIEPNIYTKTTIEKSIVSADGKTEVTDYTLAEGEDTVTFKHHITYTNNPNNDIFGFEDKLEAPYDFEEAIFYASDGTIITDKFKRDESKGNHIVFSAVDEAKKELVGQSIDVYTKVKVKADYDVSKYPDLKIPNVSKATTKEEDVDSNKVTVTPNKIRELIVKGILNDHDEIVEEMAIPADRDKKKPIVFTGVLNVPNEKDFVLESLVLKDYFHKALVFKGEDEDVLVTDKDGKNVTKDAVTITTENEGNSPVLTFNPEFLKGMKGQTYNLRFNAFLKDDYSYTDLEDGKIPNRYEVLLNGKSEQSNKVNLVPELEPPAKDEPKKDEPKKDTPEKEEEEQVVKKNLPQTGTNAEKWLVIVGVIMAICLGFAWKKETSKKGIKVASGQAEMGNDADKKNESTEEKE